MAKDLGTWVSCSRRFHHPERLDANAIDHAPCRVRCNRMEPWYRARFLRLYPMYWVAHLVYLLSPFVARLEPVDGRIILSLLGLRFIDIQMNFMYLNAAWWYFSMLIQFYLIFPCSFLQRAAWVHGGFC